ncbi:leucine-rich repeat domain-containing protein [Lysinibacter sp. HNR]|uniref:leucine-rich repeat domain-containing protein n=1 Tax=Lysinibacter sp. HNR TaxID=3031408 RepID=UPI00243509D3|nr:leucine-rich repeat domain-containing protein [Lysinibacter sp. HNR]WGD36211.1 leucine-rich repeat domain-containing protein [Lysinibacter sp. HNR]
MKKTITVLSAAALVTTGSVAFTGVAHATPGVATVQAAQQAINVIPDPGLQQALNKAIDPNRSASQPVTEDELFNLENPVDASNSGIRSLEGLGKAYFIPELNLSGNNLETLPAGEIRTLRSLKTLTLSSNALTTLPEELARLRNLESLDLSNNKIAELPSYIGSIAKLTHLSVSNNNLTTLPKELAEAKQLNSLDASSNKINTLAEPVAAPSLARLNLANNDLSQVSRGMFPNKIGWVDISNNKLFNVSAIDVGRTGRFIGGGQVVTAEPIEIPAGATSHIQSFLPTRIFLNDIYDDSGYGINSITIDSTSDHTYARGQGWQNRYHHIEWRNIAPGATELTYTFRGDLSRSFGGTVIQPIIRTP